MILQVRGSSGYRRGTLNSVPDRAVFPPIPPFAFIEWMDVRFRRILLDYVSPDHCCNLVLKVRRVFVRAMCIQPPTTRTFILVIVCSIPILVDMTADALDVVCDAKLVRSVCVVVHGFVVVVVHCCSLVVIAVVMVVDLGVF